MDGMSLVTKQPEYPDADRTTCFEEGLEFQDLVADIFMKELGISITSYSSRKYQWLKGENRQGIEIKLDTRILETGNVSIEVAEKRAASVNIWTPSGIMRPDPSWLYVQGNKSIIFIFGKNILQMVYLKQYLSKVWTPKPTIKTFRIPLSEARRLALKVFEKFNSE